MTFSGGDAVMAFGSSTMSASLQRSRFSDNTAAFLSPVSFWRCMLEYWFLWVNVGCVSSIESENTTQRNTGKCSVLSFSPTVNCTYSYRYKEGRYCLVNI